MWKTVTLPSGGHLSSSAGVVGGHEGKGLVPAWHLINCLSIFISLNQNCSRSGVITSWVWKQSHLVLPTVLDLRKGGKKYCHVHVKKLEGEFVDGTRRSYPCILETWLKRSSLSTIIVFYFRNSELTIEGVHACRKWKKNMCMFINFLSYLYIIICKRKQEQICMYYSKLCLEMIQIIYFR